MLRILFKIILSLSIVWEWNAFGVLPLPYRLEPMEEIAQDPTELRDPNSIRGYQDLHHGSKLREMELPSFGEQTTALGYEPGVTFRVPASLKTRVNFWKSIYSEYTTDQALIHDADQLDIVYKVVDVSHITQDKRLSTRRMKRKLHRFLKREIRTVANQLRELHKLRDVPFAIPLNLFPTFRKFEKSTDPLKFSTARRRIRAQRGQKDRIVKGFFFGGRYYSKMMDIFGGLNLPKEITRLTLVESGFDLEARSKVGASGVWQFMRSTGKRFMRIDKVVDERNDPINATWAAAELLRKNYESLKSWPLAITAYNHGRAGMMRASQRLDTRDIATIIDKYKARTFGFASANFYASFLAILEVEREYRKHFGKIMVDSPFEYKELMLSEDTTFKKVANKCDIEPSELATFNPGLTDWAQSKRGHLPAGLRLKVPPQQLELCNGNSNGSAGESDKIEVDSRGVSSKERIAK